MFAGCGNGGGDAQKQEDNASDGTVAAIKIGGDRPINRRCCYLRYCCKKMALKLL